MAPLVVDGQFQATDEIILDQVLIQLFRSREISLVEPIHGGPYPPDITFIEFSHPAPLLESFVFHSGSPVKLSEKLFGGDAPRLRFLDLVNCTFDWKSPRFQALTTHKLSRIPVAAHLLVRELVLSLRGTPNLKSLIISSVLDEASPAPDTFPPPGPIAHLPHLSHLQIGADYITCASLLTHPTATCIELRCIFPHAPTNLSGLPSIDTLTEAANRKVGLIRSLALTQPPILSSWAVGSRSLFTWSAPCVDWTSPVELKPQLEVHMMLDGRFLRQDAQQMLEAVLASLPLQNLESLSADNIYHEENVWLSTFGDLELLYDVSVKGYGRNSLVCALATGIPELIPATGQGFETAPHLNFVGLQTLVCNEWQFDDKEHYGASATKQFIDCLQMRHERGVVLEHLYIKDCRHLTRDELKTIRGFVLCVRDRVGP